MAPAMVMITRWNICFLSLEVDSVLIGSFLQLSIITIFLIIREIAPQIKYQKKLKKG